MEKLLRILSLLCIASATTHYKEFLYPQIENFLEAYREYSEYRTEGWKGSHKYLTNLHEKLDHLPECLNQVINYEGIDLKGSLAPIVLWRYDVVRITYTVLPNNGYTQFTRSYPHEKVQNPNNSTKIEWCQRQGLLRGLECPDFPIVDFSSKSRPWRCETRWYIFPPSPVSNPLYFERPWLSEPLRMIIPAGLRNFGVISLHRMQYDAKRREGSVDFSMLMVSRPVYDIVISDWQFKESSVHMLKPWRTTLSASMTGGAYLHVTSGREELTFDLTKEVGRPTTRRLPDIISYRLDNVVAFCRYCHPSQMFYPIDIGSLFSLSHLSRSFRVLNTPTKFIRWAALLSGGAITTYDLEEDDIMMNTSPYQLLLQSKQTQGDEYLDELRWKFELRLLLQTVIRNGSFGVIAFNEHYRFKREWKDEYYMENKDFIPSVVVAMVGHEDVASFYFHNIQLNFVSCGKADIDGLAFGELSSIFDVYIWLCILLSMILVPLMSTLVLHISFTPKNSETQLEFTTLLTKMKQSIQSGCVIEGCVMTARALLEQGDPFARKFIKSRKLHLILGPFLITSLVVSNAYKNENITKITLPRLPIPFDTFEALVEHSFRIYTRIVFIGGYTDFSKFGTMSLFQKFIKFPTNRTHHQSLSLPSELYWFARGDYSHFDYYSQIQLNLSDKVLNMLNKTMIHPKWIPIFTQGYKKDDPVLGACNGTAMFLPDLEAREVYYNLSGIPKNNGKVFLSKNPMFNVRYAIGFARWVNPNVLDRLDSIQRAGIWYWWEEFAVKFMSRVKGKSPVSSGVDVENGASSDISSNLKGNISNPLSHRYLPYRLQQMGVKVDRYVLLLGGFMDCSLSFVTLHATLMIIWLVTLYFQMMRFWLDMILRLSCNRGWFETAFQQYRVLQTLNQIARDYMSHGIIPAIYLMCYCVTLAFWTSIVMTYGTMPFEMILNFAIMGSLLSLATHLTIDTAGTILETSQTVKRQLYFCQKNLTRKHVRSCSDIKIYCGSTSYFEKHTVTVFVDSIINNMITIILAL
ncbi:unnamed protein product [Orchesella dallaii]|uniref:Uncharacterized protein n=1 Tax=Orchesella dallaii TaxID=48710 RepID=A0ABP1S7Z2_9HEXA